MLSFFFLCAFVLVAQVPSATQVVPEDVPGIVKAGTKIELVKGGLDGADDPIGLPDGTTLFTEPPANRIWKIDRAGRISVFRENSNGGLGMSLDSKGRLFSVQSAYGHTGIAVISPPETVITDNFEGTPFGRPNDLIVDKKGGVYFTDPGLNGNPDGTLRNRRNFAVYEGRSKRPNDLPGIVTGADGLIIDSEGRLYALTAAGVEIFSPQGKQLGIIHMSCNDQDCQGLAFSGPKKSTLYVAGRGAVWKMEMLSTGFKGRAK